MISVYYAKVFPFLEEDTFLYHLEKTEEERRKRIQRMKDQRSIYRSLSAGCLLHDALCERLGVSLESGQPFAIDYKKEGKPYLIGEPDINFNLSHSGDYVCCAVADVPVGVDIQKKVTVKSRIAERFFTGADNQKLSACGEEEREDLFFRMWSIKESFIKLTGKGMKQGMDSFEIDWFYGRILEEGKSDPLAYFKEQTCLTEYSFCVCSRKPEPEVVWKEMVLT